MSPAPEHGAGALRAACVLPVASAGDLLDGCLDALRAQDTEPDELVIVDDAPRGSLGDIEGAHVLRSGGRGPYAARNLGWRHADADVVLFLDVRSRPRPSWVRRMREAFADPAVAAVGSEVLVRGGDSLASRVAERQQFFALEKYDSTAFFRPYLPTCNAGFRREDIQAAGGFPEIRSGGDAHLCWRILERPGRRLVTIPEPLMEWVPRRRVRDYLEQNFRYGRGKYALRREWADAGARQIDPMSHLLLARRIASTSARACLAVARRDDEATVEELRAGGWLAFQLGYRAAADSSRRKTASTTR